jgi:epoxyqueuosine reductase
MHDDATSAEDKGRAPPGRLPDAADLARQIKVWGGAFGFDQVGIAAVDVAQASERLRQWLAQGRHGQMDYMARHAHLRADPGRLLPPGSGPAASVISVRLNYRPRGSGDDWTDGERRRLQQPGTAVISLYARGRDYHKVLRRRLQRLADRIGETVGPYGYRVCTDSAPVFEVEMARAAGLGWRGKHTLLLSREAGSTFFLGEILTDLPLPADEAAGEHCGTCRSCLDACPTGAIVAPYELDARRCISYLTIEHEGSIPPALRPLIGNRVYGCDDCQLACPWNKFAGVSALPDFDVRHGLDAAALVDLFGWSEAEFEARHAGSAIRRIGHVRWLRNIAVALGNGVASEAARQALLARADHPSPLVREHVQWALARLGA